LLRHDQRLRKREKLYNAANDERRVPIAVLQQVDTRAACG